MSQAIKERPILFNGPMVRALLDGSKSQTRRIVKDLPPWPITEFHPDAGGTGKWLPNGPAPCGRGMASGHWRLCPYGQPGDRLWVRETFALSVIDPDGGSPQDDPENYDVIYRATDTPGGGWTDGEGKSIEAPWEPSIQMPHWASRILLEIVSVRAERLQDISEDDAKAEGAWPDPSIVGKVAEHFNCDNLAVYPSLAYRMLWESINGAGSWDANPWVWVVEFKRVTP
jgi:hypothetical protein